MDDTAARAIAIVGVGAILPDAPSAPAFWRNGAELADKAGKALKALASDNAATWKALRAQGIFRGRGAPAKVAFLYTGQGSQYVNMLAELRRRKPLVAAMFAETDRVMAPLLGKPLSEFIFVDGSDEAAVARA